jgi:hypothetical protein
MRLGESAHKIRPRRFKTDGTIRFEPLVLMRLNIQLALALASMCGGCGYDTGNNYAQHGYVPEYPQPS